MTAVTLAFAPTLISCRRKIVLVVNLPFEITIKNGVYAGKYEYDADAGGRNNWCYFKDGGNRKDPHFSVDASEREFTRFHISFNVSKDAIRNLHLYYEFTGHDGLVEKKQHTPYRSFPQDQQDEVSRITHWKHLSVCLDLAQQFFNAALDHDLKRQNNASREVMLAHINRLRVLATGATNPRDQDDWA